MNTAFKLAAACLLLTAAHSPSQTMPALPVPPLSGTAPVPTQPKYDPPQVTISGSEVSRSGGRVNFAPSYIPIPQPNAPMQQRLPAPPVLPSTSNRWCYFLNGSIRAFHQPPAGYAIQCFFIVKPVDHKPLLYAAASFTMANFSAKPNDFEANKFAFASPDTAPVFLALPDVGYKFVEPRTAGVPPSAVTPTTTVTDPTFVSVGPATNSPTNNAGFGTMGGWIVRVFAAGTGELLYVNGSDDTLTRSVAVNEGYFDKAFNVLYPVTSQLRTATAVQSALPQASPAAMPGAAGAQRSAYDTPIVTVEPVTGIGNSLAVRGIVRFHNPPSQGYRIIFLSLIKKSRSSYSESLPYLLRKADAKNASGPSSDFYFSASNDPVVDKNEDWAVCVVVDGRIISIQASREDASDCITKNPNKFLPREQSPPQ